MHEKSCTEPTLPLADLRRDVEDCEEGIWLRETLSSVMVRSLEFDLAVVAAGLAWA